MLLALDRAIPDAGSQRRDRLGAKKSGKKSGDMISIDLRERSLATMDMLAPDYYLKISPLKLTNLSTKRLHSSKPPFMTIRPNLGIVSRLIAILVVLGARAHEPK